MKKSKATKSGTERPAAKPPVAPPIPLPPPRHRWLFRLMALVLIPIVTLGVLEIGLRIGGYGYSTSLFRKIHTGDQDALVNNDTFSLRFFPPELARYFGAIQIAARKPPDTIRIFVFGESAAMGDPEPAFGAIRYLEILLRERFPQQKFEVVNVSLTAINSHVILPIARECAKAQGDVWIIYMGNNEMVGPFGAATVFGAQAPPLALVRASLAVQQTRTGQLLMSLARRLRSKGTSATSWGGMEMFVGNQLPPDAPRKQTVYHNFERNLADIVDAGLDSGAKVILSTVAVNLKDCPPFASVSNSNLSSGDHATFDKLYADALAAVAQSNFVSSNSFFEQAVKLDPRSADLQYRWGQSLSQTTNLAAAREHLQLACDLDALPFRTDSRINGIIRAEASGLANSNLVLLDAAAMLATNQQGGICGNETFYEHVHFNFDGNYRLGLLWAEQVAQALPAALKSKPASPWASQETCNRLLGLSDWNRLFVIPGMLRRLQRPPLSEQPNNSSRLAALNALASELTQHLNSTTVTKTRTDFEEAIKQRPEDYYLAKNFADFLEAIGDLKAATAEWQRVQKLLPEDFIPSFQLGRLLGRQGSWPEAEASLRRAVALRPSLAEGWYELANLQAAQGNLEAALANYDHALNLRPNDVVFRCQKARSLSKAGRHAEAMEDYRRALQLDTVSPEMHYELGNELAAMSQKKEAKTQYEEALRLRPTYAQAHLNLGVLLAMEGQFDSALRQFEDTMLLDPTNTVAREYFERVQGWKKQRR